MTDIQTRAFNTEFELRDENNERTITGIAVPYGETINVGGYKERFERGALGDFKSVPVFYGHAHNTVPVGVLERGEDTDQGYKAQVRLFDTPEGNSVYAACKGGALKAYSLGFAEGVSRDEDGVKVRSSVDLKELSIVPFPAYQGAKISEVRSDSDGNESIRSESSNMNEEVTADLTEIRSALNDFGRQLSDIKANGASAEVPSLEVRSYGEYIKGLVTGDDKASNLYRAWTGGTSADSVFRDTFVGDLTRLIERPRKVINAFSRSALPAEGMNLEYAQLGSDTTQVGVQANEGDVLPYGKVAISVLSAPVKTFGGWTSMSRQEIERANVNIVDTAFRAMTQKYAAATEAYVRAQITAAAAQTIAGATIATVDGWTDFLVDAALHLDSKGLSIDGILVSGDVFKNAAKLRQGDAFFLDRNNGSLNITGLSGAVFNVPLTLVSGTNVATVFSAEAVKTYESAGVPARLQDGDITNLTNQFSVYGYLSVAVQDPKALVVRGA